MSDDPSKVTSGTDQHSERIVPVGAEFVPPLGKIATNEQIANFWVARGEWNESGRNQFLDKHARLEQTNPEEEKRQRQAETEKMRSAVRTDIARKMSAEDIEKGYLALGLTARAKEFKEEHRRAENSNDPDDPKRLRIQAGSKLVEEEEKRDQQHESGHGRPLTLKELIANAESKANADHERSAQHTFKSYAATVTGRSH